MHGNNKRFFTELKERYPEAFSGRILEVGSFDLNLTLRQMMPEATWLGIDKLTHIDYGVPLVHDSDGVDICCDVLDYELEPESFDVFICASVFEHTPEWRQIIRHCAAAVKPGGYLAISFGAEGNVSHAPDPWKPVPHQEYLRFIESQGLEIIDAFFEEERYQTADCSGGYASFLRKPI